MTYGHLCRIDVGSEIDGNGGHQILFFRNFGTVQVQHGAKQTKRANGNFDID